MKTIKLTILTLLVLGNIKIINAQNWLLQGNAIQSTDYLGTNDTNALVFSTNAIERMRMTNKGFLGIGTATPSYRLEISEPNNLTNLLHVYGKGSDITTQPDLSPFTLATFIQSDNNRADAGIRIQGARTHNDRADIAFIDLANLDNDNSGAYIMSRIAGGLVDQDPTPGPPTTPAQTNDRGYLKFYTNAGKLPYGTGEGLMERMRITDLGLVGIGTTNPQARLNIWENNQNNIALSITKEVPDVSSNVNFTNIFEVNKTDATGATVPLLVVRDTGNVGIGVDVPKEKLTVGGGAIRIEFDNRNPFNINQRQWDCLRIGTAYNSSGNNYSWFQSYAGGEGSLLSLNPAGGNVGIGTNEPTDQLTVAGTIASTTGGFKFPDGTVQTSAATTTSTFDNITVTNNANVGGKVFASAYSSNSPLIFEAPAGTVRMKIDDITGNVGIGAAPTATLTVNQASSSVYNRSLTAFKVTKKVCPPLHQSTCTGGNILEIIKDEETALPGYSSLRTVFIIQDTGNVGIGVSDPYEKLEVNGAIRLSRVNTNPNIANADGLRLGTSYTTSPTAWYSWLQSYTTNKELSLNPIGGNVGIGTNDPQEKLHVAGRVRIEGSQLVLGTNDGNNQGTKKENRALVHNGWQSGWDNLVINYDGDFEDGVHIHGPKTIIDKELFVNGAGKFGTSTNYISIGFNTANAIIDNIGSGKLLINHYSGKDVHIGTGAIKADVYLGKNLYVCGLIKAKKIRIETGWCDYVFKEDYHLKTLNEVENFIKEKGHLPDIPSEKEIETNGLELGEISSLHQLKIEEIYLYLIQFNKEIELLKTQNTTLRNQLNGLTTGN